MNHELKCRKIYFEKLITKEKQFEVRDNQDRIFSVGDTLTLLEWEPKTGFTGRAVNRTVTYILPHYPGIDKNLSILSIS